MTEPKHPLTEQHEHYAQQLMSAIWDAIGASQNKLSAHEICGILWAVMSKIGFDLNVRSAQEELKKLRDQNKQSGIIGADGFPID